MCPLLTAGVARGPLPYKLLNALRAYVDSQRRLPVWASKASTASSFLPANFAWMKTRPSATTGELLPSPTGCRQRTFGGAFHGATLSELELSRFGPSHCGQSAARLKVGKSIRAVSEPPIRRIPSLLRFTGASLIEKLVQRRITPLDAI